MKDKVKYLIIGIATMVIVGIVGTFAWLTYRSNKTAMVLTIGDLNNIQVTLQPYQINADITPTPQYNTNEDTVVNVSATNGTSSKKRVSLYYEIDEIDEELISEDFKYTITRKTTSNGSYAFLKEGDFSEAEAGVDYEILNEKIPETATYDYKVYLWVDGTQTENTEGATFNGQLRANIDYENAIMECSDGVTYVKCTDRKVRKQNVESITFLNTISNNITNLANISGLQQPVDISAYGVGDVILYFKDENANSKYEMYIAADGMILPPGDHNDRSLSGFFQLYSSITTINNLNYLDTSEVTDMSNLFATSAVSMLDLSSFDTSNVEDMSRMFYSCHSLTALDVSGFNTSHVTDMSGMFGGTTSLSTLNLNNFDTSSVENMSQMFAGMELTSLDLRSFNTSNVTNMSQMFWSSYYLMTLDLSSFDTSHVTNMSDMFSGHYVTEDMDMALQTVYVSNRWNTSAVTSSTDMFRDCVILPNYNSSVVDKTNAHYGAGGYLTYKAYP